MDNLDILDIRIIKSLLADLAVEIDSIKETVEYYYKTRRWSNV